MNSTLAHVFIQYQRALPAGAPRRPVTCVAAYDETVWVGTEDGLWIATAGEPPQMRRVVGAEGPVSTCAARSGAAWAALGDTVSYVVAGEGGATHVLDRRKLSVPVLKLVPTAERTAAVGPSLVTWVEEPHLALDGPGPMLVSAAADPAGNLYVASANSIWRLVDGSWECLTPDGLGDAPVRDIAVDSHGHIYVATNAGLTIITAVAPGHQPSSPYSTNAAIDSEPPTLSTGFQETLRGPDGLPCEDVRAVALAGRSIWAATALGAIACVDGRWRLFSGRRWLPADDATCVAVAGDGSVWVGTPNGIGVIAASETTLLAKADLFHRRLRARHVRLGYVASCVLQEPGNVDSFMHEASDNDGLWTALYVAAESYRYAVTRAEDARANAKESVEALIRLQKVTGIPGFPARAYVCAGERVLKSDGEWHPAADGSGEWKGDTSSDEIDGHFFAFSVYHDLVARGEEKRRIAEAAGAIADHLLRNGFLLVDVDGKPTTWGIFSPEMLNGPWEAQRGLNSLEILSHLKAAYHLTGEERFQDAYIRLVRNHHYALNTVKQKITAPGHVNHSDDELAFLAYYPLLMYETDPDLLRLYRISLRRSWQIERPEACPLYNVIYSALTGDREGIDEAELTLREVPMDLVTWDMRNSARSDVVLDTEAGRFGEPQSVSPVSPAERAVMKWNGNPYRLDDGSGGREEDDGTFFLLPYWMARYYGLMG